jgi:hypothetical protein
MENPIAGAIEVKENAPNLRYFDATRNPRANSLEIRRIKGELEVYNLGPVRNMPCSRAMSSPGVAAIAAVQPADVSQRWLCFRFMHSRSTSSDDAGHFLARSSFDSLFLVP